eukprot:CAMPEP_0184692452 /NCGR_PEP_ID=MMETSP0313-20130426/932_1 /TAXON_ID=2792 /ORGANISM="Porphyridium aerugineum, Strain SAG 1380-2" /LENGTH=155 /DNA_ID=CAMNT_0027150285 /DNA_START=68 /DNA_END=535 /DNA_ORIENTATION=+
MVEETFPRAFEDSKELQSYLLQRLDRTVKEIVTSYKDLIDSTTIQIPSTSGANTGSEISNLNQSYELENIALNSKIHMEATNIANGCHELLKLVSELKIIYIVQDVETADQQRQRVVDESAELCNNASDKLLELEIKATTMLAALESRFDPTSLI